MGQQQLNCKNNAKDQGKQVQTHHSNAALVMHTYKPDPLQGESTKKESNRSEVDPYTLKTSQATNKKIPKARIAQHENILRASYSTFPGAVKINNLWCEKPGKSVAQIVEGRLGTNKHFPHSQVVALAESLVYALAYLEKQQIRHHDVYPSQVHYHQGIFKLSNPLQIEFSAYSLTQNRQRFSFLAPELIAELIEDTPDSQIPPEIMYKADLFAAGMVLLQFCTLEPSSECFDEQNYSLVDQTIRSRLAKTAKLYSPTVADCVAEMLKYDVEERIGAGELAVAVFLQAGEEKTDQEKPTEGRNNGQQQQQQVPQQQQIPQQMPPRPPNHNPQHVQNQYLLVPGQQSGVPPLISKQGVPVGPNNIALPVPNYQYSRIGPQNQSLLSAGTLHNKLRVIQKINETPQEEEESEGLPSHLSMEGQRVVVQQGQPVPSNPQIMQLHQQIQQKRMSQGGGGEHGQQQQYVSQPGPGRDQNQNQQYLRPPPPQYMPQPQPQQPQRQLQGQPMRQFQPQPQSQPQPQVYRPSQPAQRPVSVRDYQSGPTPPIQNYQPIPPSTSFHHLPPPPSSSVPDYHSIRPIDPYTSSPPKPSSPSLPQNYFQKPSSPQILNKSPQSSSLQSSSLSYQDRMLLMKPTYYQLHGKNNQIIGNGQSRTSYQHQQYGQNTITSNIPQKNFEFNFTQKYAINTSDMSDYPSFKPQSQNKHEYSVPSYHSSQKYSLASDYPPLKGRSGGIGKDKEVDENGETLEQRVDRILQISRSIK